MTRSHRGPTLYSQVVTCSVLLALALVITWTLHPQPDFAAWTGGMDWVLQLGVAFAFAVAAAAASLMVLAIPKLRSKIPVSDALRRIDLTGARPLAIGLLAGLGEEALFRAALQPLLGLWLVSAL